MSVSELDPILESLSYLCNYHHVATTKESLCYGMPLKNGVMNIGLLDNAAKRAGLICDVEHGVKLESLSGVSNPVIIFMDDNSAAGVLLSVDRKFAKVYFPGSDILGVTLPLSEIRSSFNGTVAYIRPQLVLSGYKNAWDFVKKKKGAIKSPILSGLHWYATFCLITGCVLSGIILLIPYLFYSGHSINETLENGLVEQKVAVLFLVSTLFLLWLLVKEIWRRYDLVVKTKLEAKIHEQAFVLNSAIYNSHGNQKNDYFFSKQLAKEVIESEVVQFSFRFCFCLLSLVIISVYQPEYGMALQLYLLMVFLVSGVFFSFSKEADNKQLESTCVQEEVIFNAFKHREVIRSYGAWEAHYKNIFDFIRLKSIVDIDGFYNSRTIAAFIMRLLGVVALELCISYWVKDFNLSSIHLISSAIFLFVVFYSSSLLISFKKIKSVDILVSKLNAVSSYSAISDVDATLQASVDFSKGIKVKIHESEFSEKKPNGTLIDFNLECNEIGGLRFRNCNDSDRFINILLGKSPTELGCIKYGDEFVEHISPMVLQKEVAVIGAGELVSDSTLYENIILGNSIVSKGEIIDLADRFEMKSVISWHRLGINRPIRSVGESGYIEDKVFVQTLRGLINNAHFWIFINNSSVFNVEQLVGNSGFFKDKFALIIFNGLKNKGADGLSMNNFSFEIDLNGLASSSVKSLSL